MGRKKRKKFKQFKKFKVKLNSVIIWIGSLLLVSLVLLAGLGYIIYSSSIFKVESENIRSNVKLSQRVTQMIEGNSLFSLDIQRIASYILKENPEYKEVFILKRFPSRLRVKVIKRIAYAQLKGRKFFPLDKEGVIIADGAAQAQDNLIVVEIDKDSRIFRKGYKLHSRDIAYAFDLIANLQASGFPDLFRVSSINATQPEALYFMVNLKNVFGEKPTASKKIRVIIGKNDFLRKISLLEEVINVKFKGKLKLIQYIDLRYKEVYVGLNR